MSPAFPDIPDYDCTQPGLDDPAHQGDLAAYEERLEMSEACEARPTEADWDIHPEEVRRRRLRGHQLYKLQDFVINNADLHTLGGKEVVSCLSACQKVVQGRWDSDSEYQFDLTAPALRWLKERREVVLALFAGSSGKSASLVRRLFK